MSVDHKPRLLVLASTYPRWMGDHEPGFVHELCRRLADRFDVAVLAPSAPLAKLSEEMDGVLVSRFRYAPRAMETLVNDGGMVANLRRHPWKWLLVPGFLLGMLLATARQIRRGKFHAVHAHWLIPQGSVAVLARMVGHPRPPLLLTIHGGDLYTFGSAPFRWLKREVAKRAAAITVVGTAMQEAVGELAGDGVPVLVKPMGVAFSAFRPAPEVTRARSELLFVGRLVEKKGLRYLLDALPEIASAVPDVRLTVVGFGPEEAELRDRARRLGMSERVAFQGAVPQSRLPGFYQRATTLVAPFVQAESGDRDGLGLVMVEALACGCPVVTTRIPAVKDVFEGAWPEFCAEPANPRSIAEKVVRLVLARERAAADALRQGANLKRKFDWDFVANGYADLLDQLR